MIQDKFNTRIAPSPTGQMHIGTARTAILNWLAARCSNGRFVLRIDDTDMERNKPEAIQPIIDGLEWIGLNVDSVYYQSNRLDLYAGVAKSLLDGEYAVQAENGAILLKTPRSLPENWKDSIVGDVPITHRCRDVIEGLPLIRGGDKLGQPTYQFASVVDDYLMGINYIIRGVDHVPNTAKQIAIWSAMNDCGINPSGQPLPKFSHVGLITQKGKKLSKRDGAASLMEYRDKGYHPESIFAFLVRMGWGPKVDNKETATVTREMALDLFLTGGSMRSSPAGFDQNRLDSIEKKLRRRLAV